MQKKPIKQQKKRKPKSQFINLNKIDLLSYEDKRLSLLPISEFQQMEESPAQNANKIIKIILDKVFQNICSKKLATQVTFEYLQNSIQLVRKFNVLNYSQSSSLRSGYLTLESQPKSQSNHKVQKFHQKQQNFINFQKYFSSVKPIPKSTIKSRLSKFTSSHINTCMSSFRSTNYSQEKLKLRRSDVLQILKVQHNSKIKQPLRPPEPIGNSYRQNFCQPQSKEAQDMRNLYLHLRQMRQEKQISQLPKSSKRIMNSTLREKENIKQGTKKLPYALKKPKKDSPIFLFTQDQNGKLIQMKNQSKFGNRSNSRRMHLNITSPPLLTNLHQLTTNRFPMQFVKNDTIKHDFSLIDVNEKDESKENELEKLIEDKIKGKKGVFIKKGRSFRESFSEIPKFPLINNL